MDTYGIQIAPDPQDADDDDPYTCACGEARRWGDEFCPACAQERRDAEREAARIDQMADLLDTLGDIAKTAVRS